jgi:tetratricopeptide (TPR) repeat protein
MAYYDSDQLAEAVPAFEQYIPMVRAMPEMRPWEEKNKLAIALFDLDRPEDALPHVQEVVRLLRPIAAEDPATYEPELAKALDFEVERRMYSGRWGGAAREAAAESVAILRRLVAAGQEQYPGQEQYQERLARVLFYLGQASGDELAHYLDAIGILRRSGDDETPFFAQLLHMSVRPLIEAERLDEARTVGTEAVALYRKLAETNHHHVAMVAKALRQLGDLGEPDERLANLEEAVRTWRVAGISTWSTFVTVLAEMLTATASCLAENGRDGRAAAEEAVVLYREIVEDAPDDVSAHWYANDLAEAEALLRRLSE